MQKRTIRLLDRRPARQVEPTAPTRTERDERNAAIRVCYDAGETMRAIAKRFGLSQQSVAVILHADPTFQARPGSRERGSGKWAPLLEALPISQPAVFPGITASAIHVYALRLRMKFVTRETPDGLMVFRIA